jgi:hypothetical protein
MSSMDEREQKEKGEKGKSCPFFDSFSIGFPFYTMDPKIGQDFPFFPFSIPLF